jgi:hypothetical protein
MHQGTRVVDVHDLGRPALVLDAPSIHLLLLDSALTCDERTDIISRFMRDRELRGAE